MKKFGILFSLALVAGFTMLAPEAVAQSTDLGGNFAETLMKTLRGNGGIFIGVAIALLGLYTWLMKQNTWGVVMIIGGVAFTAFPGLFDGVAEGLNTVASSLGVDNASQTKSATSVE